MQNYIPLSQLSPVFHASAFILATVILWAIRKAFTRSPFKNIHGLPTNSVLRGHVAHFTDRNSEIWVRNLVETYGPLCPIDGPFRSPWIHVYDTKALHSIAVKDQDIWKKNTSRMNLGLLGPGLLTTQDEQHRKQRKMLTPVFSVAYLRNVTSLFYETANKLRDGMLKELDSDTKKMDMVKWTGRTALELIGQGALGYSFDPIIEEPADNTFSECVKSLFSALNGIIVFRVFLDPIARLGPSWLGRFFIDMIPHKRVQRLNKIIHVMHNRSVEIVTEKKVALSRGDEALSRQVGEGKDVMSILLKANMAVSEKERLSEEEVLAQVSTFILAGMDTTSNAISRLLHLLALHPDVQAKLRDELLDAGVHEAVPYDQLMELPYLDAVCRETLRLYGPVRVSTRKAAKDTVLPLHEPIRGKDGSMISEVMVPKGCVAVLNLWACNTNPALWGEDSYEWKPERWIGKLPRELEEARVPGVYSNLMSFHGGGRSCIGFKFAQLEIKVVIAVLLTNFKFDLGDVEIVWNNAAVTYPSVGDGTIAEMPLLVSALKK